MELVPEHLGLGVRTRVGLQELAPALQPRVRETRVAVVHASGVVERGTLSAGKYHLRSLSAGKIDLRFDTQPQDSTTQATATDGETTVVIRETGPVPRLEFDFLQSPDPGIPILGSAGEILAVISQNWKERAGYVADLEVSTNSQAEDESTIDPRSYRDLRAFALSGALPGGVPDEGALGRLIGLQVGSFGEE